ncbi:MAG: lysine--tRNA ligase [Candidatus Moranbacteria bacterium RIFCSPHIGHO2_12_FULL_54_9]|nr:MAG: lysine--tRNA ligase [Candidatus Moranbacteria bacterium RIFCSPHIGHO2_01_FULL_54_31]OGI26256.1 MAG: lysine--tRNA ligase [Candidatus Moranbacteria bacterium RIFCSPHIGHO2_12_FULL_54_9]
MREDIIATKREKLAKLIATFGTAYPESTPRTHTSQQVLDQFDSLNGTDKQVSVVGRVRSLRVMGKIAFCHLEDGAGQIQGFFSEEMLNLVEVPGENKQFSLFKETVELGDFLSVTGTVFLTKQNEKSIRAEKWIILSKSLLPIPTEFYGLKDEEELLRRRYLDLLVNPETKELFVKKNIFWQTVRTLLTEEKFLEVQTPVLEHIPGGAEAEPFKTHHNALDEDFYLRISLELALKRLLVGGYERVFEIGRVFRNEGIDREHLQEFDHMEFYAAYMDMEQGMALVEKLYTDIVRAVVGDAMRTEHEGETIDWSKPFAHVDYFTEFEKETGIDLAGDVTVAMLKKKADELGIKYEAAYGKGRMIDTLYKKTVRQKLIQPCFLVGHPLEVSPLAKVDPANPKRTLRFQPVAARSELGNGFAELNDPTEQRTRFEEQMALRAAGDAEAQMLDEDFIQALEYGMPPACGFGMSERFFAILMNRSIRETVIFPPMKTKEEK